MRARAIRSMVIYPSIASASTILAKQLGSLIPAAILLTTGAFQYKFADLIELVHPS